MLLKGFDAPFLRTIFVDKPMQGHGLMLEKYDIACDIMHSFDRHRWVDGKPSERLALLPVGWSTGKNG